MKGHTLGAHDLIIAATAISLDHTVVTVNRRDSEKIEGLKLEVRPAGGGTTLKEGGQVLS